MLVLDRALHELGLEHERVGRPDGFARLQPGDDLGETIIAAAQNDGTPLEAIRHANKDCLFTADRLNGARGHDHGGLLLLDRDFGRHERARPPHAVGVGNLRYDARQPRLLVEERAYEDDRAVHLVPNAAGRDDDGLTFLDGREIGWADGEIDPYTVEIDDHEQFRLEIVASYRGSKIDLAFDHPARDRRPHFLPAQQRLGLVGQGRDVLFHEAKRQQLLARNVQAHAGLRRNIARPQILLLGRDLLVPQRLVTFEQVLLQLIGQLRRKVLAFGVRHFAAFEDGDNLVLGNPIAQLLAQFRDRG